MLCCNRLLFVSSIRSNTLKHPKRYFSYVNIYSAIASSTPVCYVEENLLQFHQWSCLPWWVIIGISTLTIRSCVFPLVLHQQQVMSRLHNIQSELATLAPELNKEVNIAKGWQNWDKATARKVYKIQMRQLYRERVVRDNCHPFKILILGFIQMPVWVCFSIAVRQLCFWAQSPQAPASVLSLKHEGVLWFPDLTSPDVLAIPLALFLVNIALIEVHAFRGVGQGSTLQKVFLNASRGLTVIVAAAATLNPSGVTLYWLCSSSVGLLQQLLLRNAAVRKVLNLHPLRDERNKTV